jgi:microcompartment protein CcmK/EutM
VAVAAVVGGVVLGVVDLLLQRTLPYPWANLANSSAVWALAAYGFGLWVRTPWWRAAMAGAVLLVVAVPGYYLAATIFLDDPLARMWDRTALVWMAFGVIAGLVFGFGATLVRTSGWQQLVGVALPGAVLFAEALVMVLRGGSGSYRRDQVQTAVIEAVLGVVVILVVGRTARQRLGGLAFSVPLAVVGMVAFQVGGF